MEHHIDHNPKSFLYKYAPVLVVVAFALIFSSILMKDHEEFMYRFMGFFLSLFALFKWVDIKGFMVAFKEYDLISKVMPAYLYVYPIIEAGLGFAYIALLFTHLANWALIGVMGLNSISVIFALIKGKKVDCACLGTNFRLPLTVVSLLEILLMLGMAVLMVRK